MSRPNLWALAAVIAGIGLGACWAVPPVLWILGGLLLLGLIIRLHLTRHYFSGWLLLVLLLCGSACLFGVRRGEYQSRLRYNQRFAGKNVILAGRIVGRPERAAYGFRFDLRVKAYRGIPRGKLTVYYYRDLPETWLGREVRVTGRFKPVRTSANPIWPDFYEKRRLTGRLIVAKRPGCLVGRTGGGNLIGWANGIRMRLAAIAREKLPPLHYQVLQGMLFGNDLEETGKSGTVLEDFRRTGTIHLLSVSGLHVGFVVAGLTCLLGWLRVPSPARIPFIIVGVGFYILMTGMETPVLRSGVMLVLYLMAQWLGAKDDPVNRLCLAALLLLTLNPYQLFEIGFLLSFTATAGVIWLYPLLKECFPARISWLKLVWRTVLVSVAAQAMVLPLSACYFYQISWVAPLANLLLALPALLIVVGGLAGELIGLGWPWLGRLMLGGIDGIIGVTLKMMHCCALPGWAVTGTPAWPWPWIGAYYLGMLLLVGELRPNLINGRRTVNYGALSLAALAGLTLLAWMGFYFKTQAGYLELTCIDVGQGDAIFLRTPDGVAALVDGGADGQGSYRVLPYLRRHNITRLELAVGTHGHDDHLGGLDEVLRRIPVRSLYLPRRGSPVLRKLLHELKDRKLRKQSAVNGERLRLGKYVVVRMFTFPDAANENDRSLVLLVGYGNNRLLLTGDLGAKGEAYLADHYPQLLRAAVLKVGHHGSATSSTWRLLGQVRPRIGLISVGTGNRYGLPETAALNRLHSLGTAVYRTDLQGTITLRIYPDRILAHTER
jgi:competence protein ComEC